MTRHELLVVLVRLSAIGFGLALLRAIPATLLTLSTGHTDNHFAAVVVAAHALAVLIAIALWKFPFAIAKLLLPPREGQPTEVIAWSPLSAVETGSIVIGLFYALYALSDLLYWLAFAVALGAENGPQPPLDAHQWASIITTLAEVAMSLLLIFGAARVARFIYDTRYAGKASSK